MEKTSEDGEGTFGGYIFITVYFDHEFLWFDFTTSKTYMHVGNSYFKEMGKHQWYIMTNYEQANKIYNIFKKMKMDIQ